MSTREVNLEGSPPWGFRMNGGADSGHPLRISRVCTPTNYTYKLIHDII